MTEHWSSSAILAAATTAIARCFREVHGLKNVEKIGVARARAGRAQTPAETRKLEAALTAAETLDGGSIMLDDGHGAFRLFDFYGNPLASQDGKIVVPLNGLRLLPPHRRRQGFVRQAGAMRYARPMCRDMSRSTSPAHDLTAPIESKPELRLTLTNILNRPITGKLTLKLGDLTLDGAEQTVALAVE